MGLFADLLAHPGVDEVVELRSRFGFMAYHGGSLEEMTDVIARRAAERSGASYYGVLQPSDLQWHIPSIQVSAADSPALTRFLDHVDIVITIHGFGRQGLLHLAAARWAEPRARRSRRRPLCAPTCPPTTSSPTSTASRRSCAACIPPTPSTCRPDKGVQIELPPRVRGSSPLWWDWEGPGSVPHTERLIDALVAATHSWTGPGTGLRSEALDDPADGAARR